MIYRSAAIALAVSMLVSVPGARSETGLLRVADPVLPSASRVGSLYRGADGQLHAAPGNPSPDRPPDGAQSGALPRANHRATKVAGPAKLRQRASTSDPERSRGGTKSTEKAARPEAAPGTTAAVSPRQLDEISCRNISWQPGTNLEKCLNDLQAARLRIEKGHHE